MLPIYPQYFLLILYCTNPLFTKKCLVASSTPSFQKEDLFLGMKCHLQLTVKGTVALVKSRRTVANRKLWPSQPA